MEADVPPEAPEETEVCAGEQQDSSTEEAPTDVAPATAPSGAVACRGLTTLSLDTPPLTVASAPEVDRSRSALELPVSCADAAPSDAACTLMPAMTAPPADEFAAAIAAANAVCFFPELTKVPHILEPSTTPSDRTGDMPTREALEPKVNVSSCQPRPLPQTPPRGPWVPT